MGQAASERKETVNVLKFLQNWELLVYQCKTFHTFAQELNMFASLPHVLSIGCVQSKNYRLNLNYSLQ